jgi:DNA-binding MarR family transcriptional regulator
MMNCKQWLGITLVGLIGMGSLIAKEHKEQASPGLKQQHKNNLKKHNKKKQQRKVIYYLNANHPDEIKAIRKLMKSDPAVAKEKMKKLINKGLAEIKAAHQEFVKLIKQYRQTKDEAILDKIRTKISINYDKRIEYATKVVHKLDKGLNKAKDKLSNLKNNREKNIDKIITRIKKGKGKKNS